GSTRPPEPPRDRVPPLRDSAARRPRAPSVAAGARPGSSGRARRRSRDVSRPSAALCLDTAVGVAAEAAVHALGGGGAGIGAFLLAGRAPILRDGLSDELHLAVLDALPLLAQELRRSGHPIRIPAERVPDEHATLR